MLPNHPYRILTVCTGNICRSPIAEVVLAERFAANGLQDRVVIDSGAISSEELGNPMDPRARKVLLAHGYPDHRHSARQVDPAWLGERDLVLAMTSGHAAALRRLAVTDEERLRIRLYREFDPASPQGVSEQELDINDPWYGDMTDFEQTISYIEAGADPIVDFVRARIEAG
ncbi:low molecular weight protein-tyrosine-phosphatase [Saxibacter everestensis]|uniref:protein-tyrosine-phosphatase n=1 Tax=Saxibacter everestensis TaxID=2909229 RepID=A0ABY8QSF0_9MICO|nr:low molecular weight protein-tyrosine-phosphatase [Brevibacteriaceae bacterium ZFBP1038]